MPFAPTTTNSVFFLLLFILAFFPSLFVGLLKLPFRLPSTATAATSALPYCTCIPPPQYTPPAPPPPALPTTLPAPPVPPPSPLPPATRAMAWHQSTFTLRARTRGSYLVTDEVLSHLPEVKSYKVGLLNLFVQHTSCALSLNENWDDEVRADMSDALDRIAPEDRKGNLYRHSAEGLDDMPAHIKSALIGASVTVPIRDGKLATGTWQGIWYLEFRASKHSRKVVATIQGEKM
ncbi:hypothetical protein LTR16_001946 [Cryomyces antarcticus]|uniref:Secondary thiamine-phosphate synthase enzyme n=1 Tax=Cryomyces antarcticus TaxID=329879 RepID=A0ABR0LPW7_9PEZI|nr:hypothetical protein LTR16_001946 [Cryomyces antarcticus]